jgi:hypothetical protein
VQVVFGRINCSLNHADCSLDHANCSLNHADCSLNHANCSLNHANCSLNQVVFGRMGVTLITSNELSTATELAVRLVSQSGLHPDFKNVYLQEDDLLRYPITRDKVHHQNKITYAIR